jgi:hypothetical protein
VTDGTISERSRNTSKYVMIRFALKLAVFSLFCAIQIASGGPNLFFDFITLTAGASVLLALQCREIPLARSLNHWDEALCFGLISHLGKGLLGIG